MTNCTIFDILCNFRSMNKFMCFNQFVKTIKKIRKSQPLKAINISLSLLPFSNFKGAINA
jgi:hypothetical protein